MNTQNISSITGPSSGAQKSLSVTWTGRANTDMQFSEFINDDHTILFRFMPQFRNTYYGPIVAENGTGRFVIGQGDFYAVPDGSKLFVAIGNQSQIYSTNLIPGQWHHLGLVGNRQASQTVWQLFLNGIALPATITVSNTNSQLPVGTLCFGKRTPGATLGNQNAQYYGLIDDVAIFNRSLNITEIQTLGAPDYCFTGTESGLISCYTFNNSETNQKLKRPITYSGAAKRVTISGNHNSTDSNKLPLPTAHKTMFLPTPPGEEWEVIQGLDDDTVDGTHKGYASFCWDLKIARFSQSNNYPFGTRGAPFYTSATGTIVKLDQSRTSGQSPSNIIEIQHGPNEFASYLHLERNSAEVSIMNTATRGDQLAKTGDVGAGIGDHHIHIAVTDKPDGTPGFVTFPIAFSDYEVKQQNGSWIYVARGIPQKGDVIRRPLPEDLPYNVTSVWRKSSAPEIQIYGEKYSNFRTRYDELWSQGWRLKKIKPHGYANSSQVRYTAVWEKSTAPEIQIYSEKYNDFRTYYDELWLQDWRLKHLEPCVINNQVLYTAVWEKSTTPEIQLYGRSYNDFRTHYDKLWPQGWRLKLIKPYVVNGLVYYTAVWRPSTAGEIQIYGRRYSDFKANYDNLWSQGWRLKLLETYDLNGITYYTAVWSVSNAAEIQLHDKSYQNFRSRYDELWPDNWRLFLLNINEKK